jgi:DNA-binding transcriptional ArsR family regulator
MKPTYTMEDLFATPARVRVLRALARSSQPRSIRQVARAAGISHTAAGSVLADLEDMGMVRSTATGRSLVHQLIPENIYVRLMLMPAIEAETDVLEELKRDLVDAFSTDAISLILYGSYAYDDQDEDSDIDVFAVAADQLGKQRLEEIDMERGAFFLAKYGSPLHLIAHTLVEARRLDPGRTGFTIELDVTGIILSGLGTSEWGTDEPEEAHPEGGGV